MTVSGSKKKRSGGTHLGRRPAERSEPWRFRIATVRAALSVALFILGVVFLPVGEGVWAAGRKEKNPTVKGESMGSGKTEKATLGGGCFWCIEAVFERVEGVKSAVSGYAGGTKENPTYEQVCTGKTGHAEVVQIEYDTARISYEEILDLFWKAHDPTTLNRQGADAGTQYRSIILTQDERQRAAAEKSVRDLEASGKFSAPVVTEIKPLEVFYPAEDYHQDFYDRNTSQGYCMAVISPKLKKIGLAGPRLEKLP